MGGAGRGAGAGVGGGVCGEHVVPRRQSMAATVFATLPKHLRHDCQEGGPQRLALAANLAATHRVAAGTCEARARALERSCGTTAATAIAVGLVNEGAPCRQRPYVAGGPTRGTTERAPD